MISRVNCLLGRSLIALALTLPGIVFADQGDPRESQAVTGVPIDFADAKPRCALCEALANSPQFSLATKTNAPSNLLPNSSGGDGSTSASPGGENQDTNGSAHRKQ